jgi:drug/metabolite transporter (DMT)-like permease
MKNLKYIFMVLLGGTLYGTMSSFVKLSYADGYHAAEISFFQALVAAVILGTCAFVTHDKRKGRFKWHDFFSLMFTGSAIGMTNYLEYQSLDYIPASLAIIILMQYTWISLLLEWTLFHQRPLCMELATTLLVLVGTVLAGGLFEIDTFHFLPLGIILALGSSVTYAIYIVANSRVARNVRWQTKSMSIMMGSSISIFIVNVQSIVSTQYLSGNFFLWIMFLAVAGTTIPTALFAIGIPKIGAGMSGILMTVELPVAVICSYFILHESITPLRGVGVAIMLTSIALMNHYKVSKSKRERA